MKIRSSEIKKGVLTLSIEVPAEDHQSYLDRSAKELSKDHPVAGFRPGNAPYDVMAKLLGGQAILEHAAESMVSKSYTDAVTQEKFETIGTPKIQVEMLAPGNPLVYTATVSLLPEVTIGEFNKITLEVKTPVVEESEIDKVLEDLREMVSTEASVNRASQPSDAVLVDLAITLGGVPVDGGSVKDHKIFLDKEYYVPGLSKELVGMDVGATKTFQLPFPSEHYQKNLAGKLVDFTVTTKQVLERTKPVADDVLAQKLGQKDLASLKEILKSNVLSDKERTEQDRREREMIDQLVKLSRFTDIPEDLVTQEAWRMMEELEERVRKEGGEFNAYLESLKKTRDELYIDFAPKAVERVKAALLLRSIGLDHPELEVTEVEIDRAVEEAKRQYKKDQEMEERLNSPEMRDHARSLLRNRKVLEWITAQVTSSTATA